MNPIREIVSWDLGKVLRVSEPVDGRKIKPATVEEFLRFRKPEPGAFQLLSQLAGQGHINYILSRSEQYPLEWNFKWFEYFGFFEISGVDPANVRFVQSCEEKAVWCRSLGVTRHIDNKWSNLRHMESVSKLFLINPSYQQHFDFVSSDGSVRQRTQLITNLEEAVRDLLAAPASALG